MAPKRSQTKRPKKASVAPKKKGASKITNRRREHARVDEEDGAEVDGVGDEAGEPQSRKEKNAHRFLRFSERIAAIDVDVHHRHAVTSLAERPRQDSFFQDSLEKWRELNLAREFVDYYTEALDMSQSLPQVVLHQSQLLDGITKRLHPGAQYAIPALVSLAAELCRDLRGDFMPLLPHYLDAITNVLREGLEHDPEVLESVFTSLAYIFKWLQKDLAKDLSRSLAMTRALRHHHVPHVRSFACEALAFLFRSARGSALKDGLRSVLLESTEGDAQLNASSILLSESVRGVSGGLHSQSERIMGLLFDPWSLFSDQEEPSKCVLSSYAVGQEVIEALQESLKPSKATTLWACLLASAKRQLEASVWQALDLKTWTGFVDLFAQAIGARKGALVQDFGPLFKVARDMSEAIASIEEECDEEVFRSALDFLRTLSVAFRRRNNAKDAPKSLREESQHWRPLVARSPHGPLLNFAAHLISVDSLALLNLAEPVVESLINLLQRESSLKPFAVFLSAKLFEVLPHGDQMRADLISSHGDKLAESLEVLLRAWPGETSNEAAFACFQCMPHLTSNAIRLSSLREACECGMRSAMRMLHDERARESAADAESYGATLVEAMKARVGLGLAESGQSGAASVLHEALESFQCRPDEPFLLLALANCLDSGVECPDWDKEQLRQLLPLLQPHFRSSVPAVRVAALKTAEACDAGYLSKLDPNDDHEALEKCLCFRQLREVSDFPGVDVLNHSRRAANLMTALQRVVATERLPAEYAEPVLSSLLGELKQKFSFLWPSINPVAGDVLRKFPSTQCLFFQTLADTQREVMNHVQGVGGEIFDKVEVQSSLAKAFSKAREALRRAEPDAVTRFCNLINVLHKASSVADENVQCLGDMFLNFLAPYENEETLGGKRWRSALQAWLKLLKEIGGGAALKGTSIGRRLYGRFLLLLKSSDWQVQQLVLDCLSMWRLNFLNPYIDHIKKFASPTTIKDAMATFSVRRYPEQGEPSIKEEHRAMVLRILVNLLVPRVTDESSGKSHGRITVSRRAALSYLANLEPTELIPFMRALFGPLVGCFDRVEGDGIEEELSDALENGRTAMERLNYDSVHCIANRKKLGILKTATEALKYMGEAVQPFIHHLLAFATLFLEMSTKPAMNNSYGMEAGNGTNFRKHRKEDSRTLREIRKHSLGFFAISVRRHPSLDYGSFLPRLFNTIDPLVDMLESDAASNTLPPLLNLFERFAEQQLLAKELSQRTKFVNKCFHVIGAKKVTPGAKESALFVANRFFAFGLLSTNSVALLLEQLRLSLEREQSKPGRPNCEVELDLLEMLGYNTEEREPIEGCVKALLPLMKATKGRKNLTDTEREPVMIRALEALTALLLKVHSHSAVPQDCAWQLSDLVGRGGSKEYREKLVKALESLEPFFPGLQKVVDLLRRLNAFSGKTAEEPDYDSRLDAYGECTASFFKELSDLGVSMLVQQAMLDLHMDDMAIRHAALKCLASLLEAASEESDARRGKLSKLTMDKIYPKARTALCSTKEYVRADHLTLLRDASRSLPSMFPEFQSLWSSDPEQDFFTNIAHIQAQKRSKALRDLRGACNQKRVPPMVAVEVCQPLLDYCLTDNSADVSETANACLGDLTMCLSWGAYRATVKKYLRLLEDGSWSKKMLCRVIANLLANIENFPTDTEESLKQSEGSSSNVVSINSRIHFLQKEVLPSLERHLLVEDDHAGGIRSNAFHAAIKAIQALPPHLVESQLYRTVGRAAEKLRSKLERVRDGARNALLKAADEFGTEHLRAIVSLLRSILTKGFQVHVLSATVHALLERSSHRVGPGELDSVLDEVMPVLSEDMFGQPAEEKEVPEFAKKAKETKKSKSYECLEILSGTITMPDCAQRILRPIHEQLPNANRWALRQKIDTALQYISRGMLKNPTFSSERLLLFAYATAEDALDAEAMHSGDLSFSGPKRSSKPPAELYDARQMRQTKVREAKGITTDLSGYLRAFADQDDEGAWKNDGEQRDYVPNSELLLNFALYMIRAHLKRHLRVDDRKKEEGILHAGGRDKLAGLIPLLVRSLKSMNTDAVEHALRSLSHILPLEIAGIEAYASEVEEQLFKILEREANMTTELAHEACKALATIIRDHDTATLSDEQIRFLVTHVFADLEDPKTKNTTFTLLRAVLSRKPLLPEVYDLMERVSSVMVRSQDFSTRELCARSLVSFLLNFPLSEKRLHGHLEALCANLSFEHPTGRKAALGCLQQVASKFPQELLDEEADFLFLPLVTRLTGDEDSDCRQLASEVISALLQGVSVPVRDKLVKYPVKWIASGATKLRRAGAHVTSLLLDACPRAIRSDLDTIISNVKVSLHEAALHMEQVDQDDPTVWQPVYQNLVLLERVIIGKHVPPSNCSKVLWDSVLRLALYPHSWVRKSVARLVASCLASSNDTAAKVFESSEDVYNAAWAMCKQLIGEGVDEEHAGTIVDNLVAITELAWKRRESEPGGQVAIEGQGESNDEEAAKRTSTPRRALRWTARRLGTIAVTAGETASVAALEWLRRVPEKLGREFAVAHLRALLFPLFKLTDEGTQNVFERARERARLAVDAVRSAVPEEEMARAWAEVQAQVRGKRQEKRKRRAIEAVTHPEERARKRLAKSRKKRKRPS